MRSLAAGCLVFALASAACADGDADAPEGGRFSDPNGSARTDEVKKDGADAAKGAGNAGQNAGQDEQAGAAAPAPPKTPPAAPTNTCREARDLGSVAGDDDGAAVTARGTCSEWVKVRVTETSKGLGGLGWVKPMRVRATLVSPSAADYDVMMYVNAEADTVECSTVTMKSEAPGNRSDAVTGTWGEDFWTVWEHDDSRTVSFEVRAKDPSKCGQGEWALLVEGNR